MVQVHVSEGILEGEVIQNEYGGSYCSFKGIPYAKPPLGELRFQSPQPPIPWKGVRSAKQFGSDCYQHDIYTNTGAKGSEDCLYLNVYTPNVSPNEPLAVMVWIHGGGFVTGSGAMYGAEFLTRQGVVLVTINYRLEVLGFLCLDTKEVPGNAGMKDQVQALRWVQENISKFGGDPNNVTIFGESAGGSCVSYHLISPMTKRLFKRAITQSGTSNCNLSHVYKPRERAFALGRKLGLYTEDVNALYEFLKSQPCEALVQATVPIFLFEKNTTDLTVYFNVVDEKDFGDQERFFYGDLYDILRQGIHEGVDVMTGYTADEGILNLGTPDVLKRKIEIARNYPEFFVPLPMKISLPIEEQLRVGQRMKKYYFKKEIITNDDWESLVKFFSMNMFVFPTIQWCKLCAIKSNIYLYKFTCKSKRNIFAHLFGSGDIIGAKEVVAHADDVLYLFNLEMGQSVDPASEEFKYIDRFTKIWTNFAKYGNPTPDDSLHIKWPLYTLETEKYMDLGNDLTIASKPEEKEIQLWEQIYKKYASHNVYSLAASLV